MPFIKTPAHHRQHQFAVALSDRLAGICLPDWSYWPLWGGFAMTLEYLQGAMRPLRIFSIEDAYANLAGVVAALVVWLVISRVLQGLVLQNNG